MKTFSSNLTETGSMTVDWQAFRRGAQAFATHSLINPTTLTMQPISFNYPLTNLYVSMLQRLGLEVDSFSSGTGTLTNLEMVS